MSPALLSLLAGLGLALALRAARGGGALSPRTLRLAAWGLVGLGLVLALARLWVPALAAAGVGTALLLRPGSGGGRRSTVRTDRLEMTLDHDSGAMEGRVLEGSFSGRALESLSREELARLTRELDPKSLRLLERWLDRAWPDWREAETRARAQAPSGGGGMTRQRALAALGLREGAGREEILAAHRRLMKAVHPDRGGSEALAAEVNAAKDFLLDD